MASEFAMEIACVEWVIGNEIAQGMKQKDIAMTFAMALCVQSYKVDWPRICKAISTKWPKGLNRVKTMGWKILDEKRKEHMDRVAASN